jgi:hypothetical protein
MGRSAKMFRDSLQDPRNSAKLKKSAGSDCRGRDSLGQTQKAGIQQQKSKQTLLEMISSGDDRFRLLRI